jgi:hypothetical protein
MATGPITQISDIIVPEIFTPYMQQETEQKSRIIQSGALVRDAAIDAMLEGAGLTFNVPSFKDLDDDDDNISSDAADDSVTGGSANSVAKKMGTAQETAVRLSRNQSWSTSDLASALAGPDPMDAIASRVSTYWARRLQAAFVATVKGVMADNAAAPAGTEHVQNDLTNDVSGAAYSAGVTDFSRAAFLDTTVTLGDSMDDLGLILVHAIVMNRIQKNNDIDYIRDSEGNFTIPTYLGRLIVMDDGMPAAGGVFESWMFGPGAVRLGMGIPKVANETTRDAKAGNGGGAETMHDRVEWALHPVGHQYSGTAASGGPSNAATTNNLGHAGSFTRVYPERKQIKIARLITREFAV